MTSDSPLDKLSPMPIPPTPATPEEIRKYIRAHYALGLPSGSVRALLALIVFGGIWTWMWLRPDTEVPAYLRDLMFIVMGHYFAARHKAGQEVGPPPLYLPRGSVRTLLFLGCAVLTGALMWQHRMLVHEPETTRLSHAGVMLILVAGFMLGVVLSHLTRGGLPRYLEDLRAILSLLAGVVLMLLVFGFLHVPDTGWLHRFQRWTVLYHVEDVLAAVVGFYFGSKS